MENLEIIFLKNESLNKKTCKKPLTFAFYCVIIKLPAKFGKTCCYSRLPKALSFARL